MRQLLLVKKPVIIISITILLAITVLVIISKRSAPPTLQPTPPETSTYTPHSLQIDPPISQPQNIQFVVKDFPPPQYSTLPLYFVEPITQDHINSVAKTLGYDTAPDTFGQKLRWRNENSTLLMNFNPTYFFYTEEHPLQTPAPSVDVVAPTVNKYLDLIEADPPITFKEKHRQFADSTGTVHAVKPFPDTANILQLTYQFFLDTFPLYLNPFLGDDVSFTFTGGPLIQHLTVSIPPQIMHTEARTPITPRDALLALSHNKGLLITATPNYQTEETVDPKFSRVTISKMDVIYMYQKNDKLFVPTYRFQGEARDSADSSVTYDVTYIISAIGE